jgi:E3 Ubiquitin ligase
MLAGTLSLSHSSTSIGFYFVLASLAGVVIGPLLFFIGFRMFRYKRMILNTPLSKIHSASVGLVEVTGSPTGPKTLAAPVTGDPCYYYRVQAWQWQESGKNHVWKQVLDESLYLPFFLEDSTGRVLIDPQGAEMDVHRSFTDEIGASFFNSRDLLPVNVRDFLVKRGLVPYEKIRVEERSIQPGYPLFVFGTLGDNPARGSWEPRPHFAGGGGSSFNLQLSDGPGLGISFGKTTLNNQPRPLNDVAMNARSHLPGTQVQRFEMKIPLGGGLPVISNGAAVVMNRTSGSFAVRAISQSSAGVTILDSNAPANPSTSSFDLQPSSAISKGERKDPFTISCHSQKEVVQSLAWKSTLYIWGGPVLGTASLYFLLLYWGFISL